MESGPDMEEVGLVGSEAELDLAVPGDLGVTEKVKFNRVKELIVNTRSLLATVASGLIVLCFGPAMIAAGRLKQPRSNRIASWIHQHTWSIPTLKMANIELKVIGLENLDSGSAQILASNHQGMLDNLAIPAALARESMGMSFVAKRELLKIPIFGKAIESLGVPTIDRSDPEKAKLTLAAVLKMIRDGLNVVVYIEGKRTEDGSMRKVVKKGFAYMAIGAGAPVVPVCVTGSFECMPKGKKLPRPGVITVEFGKPIATADMSLDCKKDIDDLVELTRKRILEMGA